MIGSVNALTHRRAPGRPSSKDRGSPALAAADDDALLSAIATRHAGAVEEAYDRYATTLYRLALILTTSRGVAEDAVVRAFLALWTHPGNAKRDGQTLHAALASSVYAHATDAPRGRHRKRGRPAARGAFAALPPVQRDLLALTLLGDHTRREAALRVGVPDTEAAALLAAALQSISSATDRPRRPAATAKASPPNASPPGLSLDNPVSPAL